MTENISAFVLISMVDHFITLHSIFQIKGVEKLYEVSGQYDAIAIINTPIIEFHRTLKKIKRLQGVTAANSILILNEVRYD